MDPTAAAHCSKDALICAQGTASIVGLSVVIVVLIVAVVVWHWINRKYPE